MMLAANRQASKAKGASIKQPLKGTRTSRPWRQDKRCSKGLGSRAAATFAQLSVPVQCRVDGGLGNLAGAVQLP
jgi:hypothetical protein